MCSIYFWIIIYISCADWSDTFLLINHSVENYFYCFLIIYCHFALATGTNPSVPSSVLYDYDFLPSGITHIYLTPRTTHSFSWCIRSHAIVLSHPSSLIQIAISQPLPNSFKELFRSPLESMPRNFNFSSIAGQLPTVCLTSIVACYFYFKMYLNTLSFPSNITCFRNFSISRTK